jgi:hypothetical protein
VRPCAISPGVEVGGERRADHGDEHRQELGRELDPRDQRPGHNLAEVGPRQDRRADVGQQRQGEPAEGVADEGVGAPDLQRQDDERGRGDQPGDRHRDEEVDRGRHATEVGGGLDGVADQHPDQGRPEDPARVVVADDVEEASSGDLAELGGEMDDREHHREGDGGGPEEGGAELGPGAGVGADGRAVVVVGAGDEAEAQGADDAGLASSWFRRLVHELLGRHSFLHSGVERLGLAEGSAVRTRGG